MYEHVMCVSMMQFGVTESDSAGSWEEEEHNTFVKVQLPLVCTAELNYLIFTICGVVPRDAYARYSCSSRARACLEPV